jgi:hypothetical protein
MTRFVSIQTNFSTGEMDPLLRARVDLPAYSNALEEATNVVVQPQGGVRRRPGLRYVTALPNTSTDSAGNGVRLVPFEFSTTDSYMLCFTHNRMYVFKAGALVTNINSSGNPYLDTSSLGLTGARLANLSWTQSADTLIVCNEEINPVKIVRGANDASWTGSLITFNSIPKYAFIGLEFSPQGTITPSAVSGNINLTASFAEVTGTAQSGAANSITLAAGASGTNDFYNGLFIEITSGTGSGQVKQITDYNGTSKEATVDSAWTTAPDNTSVYSIAVFKSAAVGQFINARPQGRVKIVAITSNTVARVTTEDPFFDVSAVANGNWDIGSGNESVWSSARGWPRSATFHEGRLYFGGSKSRPSTIWGSKVGLFFDFAATQGLDDDAVEATLDTNTFNAITDITSGRDLQVFTTGGEFYVPQEGLDPVTPTNFFVKSATRNGSQPGIRVQQLESGTLFVQRQGKSLNEMAFTDTQLTYVTSKISLLSGHLLRNPVRMALRRSVATDENDLLLIANSTDGSIAAFSLLRSQNVIAPSEFTTDGEFIDVGVDLTTIYTVVKRTVNAATVYYVERFDDTLTTDSAVTGGAGSSASTHLVGKTVDIILDGSVQATQVVPGGGTVTFPRAAASSYQIGLDYSVKVVTMPADLKISAGTRLGFKKRIVEVNVFVKDTQHLKINGTDVPFRSLDDPNVLDEEVPEFTGTKTLPGILGYSDEGKITIEQDIPLKMILLGLEYKISTYPGT